MKIKIQRKQIPGDPDARIYFSRVELTSKPESLCRGMKAKSTLVQAIMEIPGVAFCNAMPYYVIIAKPPVFEWSEIEPKLLALMSAFLIDIESVNKSEPPAAENWEDM